MCDPGYVGNAYLNADLTFDEVNSFLSKLKTNKSVGLDFIPNEVLKAGTLTELLVSFFNMCFTYNKIPSVWLKAVIIPIPKSSSKDPCIPLNYRAISLLSCVYKTFSGILNTRLVSYLEDNSLFVDEQNGFRKGRSCQDHIFSLTSIIRNRIHKKLPTFCAFVDFEKAFDWVNRDLLLYKLLKANVDGKMYRAIKSIYSGTTSCVRINSYLTDSFVCSSGVRQGDNLSSTLFSVFINDLAQEINSLNVGINITDEIMVSLLLYADDIVLIAESEEKLQKMLKCMHKWCLKWFMNVNVEKN